ncbi:MAG: hypothetical protein ABEJ93_01100, partial [Candidatus Nanohalobium sp.]
EVHPEHPERGTRSPELETENGELKVFIDASDFEDGFIRLKGLCNVEIKDRKAEFREGDHRDAMEKDADFIHWTPEDAEEASVEKPDGEKITGRIEPNTIEEGEVVQFERFGFARKEGEGLFYYAHQ